jgi:predicted SAM-dependent methyltransferase
VSLWVNLGCGPFPAPDPWQNVDAQEGLEGVQVTANVLDGLPYRDGSVDRLYCGHVFEHMTYLDQLPRALAECKRVLAPDGVMMVVGPDLWAAITRFPHEVEGMWPKDPWGHNPALHSWPPTAPMQEAALLHAGWECEQVPIEDVDDDVWPVVSHIGWQFAFRCALPG